MKKFFFLLLVACVLSTALPGIALSAESQADTASNGRTSTSSAAPSSGEGVGKGQKQLGREHSVTRPVRELLAGIGGNSSACVFPGRGA